MAAWSTERDFDGAMIRRLFAFFPAISLLFFPFSLTVILTLLAAYATPLMPLAIGVLADTLYFSRGVASVPFYTLVGFATTVVALLVRRFIETSIMRG